MSPTGYGGNAASPLPYLAPHEAPHETWTEPRELLALRAWRLVRWRDDGDVRLQSLTNDSVWHGPVFRADRPPEVYGPTGVYAVKPSARPSFGNEFTWLTGHDAWIWGWVALSGRVVEYTDGYRAESAVIRQLRIGVLAHLNFPTAEDVASLSRSLERRYQCPAKAGYYEPRKACRMRGYLPAWAIKVLPEVAIDGAPPPAVPVRAEPVWVPRTRKTTKRSSPGFSGHGLRFDAVVAAFKKAEKELGRNWQISGRGHTRRVTLDARYSRRLWPATRCWERLSPNGAGSTMILFPLVIVQRAARILKVKKEVLISHEY